MKWLILATLVAGCGGTYPHASRRAEVEHSNAQDPKSQILTLEGQIDGARWRLEGRSPQPSPPDGTAAGAPPSCTEICDLSGYICRAQADICRLADELAEDWARGRCEHAKTSCTDARKRCDTCSSPERPPR
jgi:hypothetical protein